MMVRSVLVIVLVSLACAVSGCGATEGNAVKASVSAAEGMYKQAQALVAEGQLLEAVQTYRQFMEEHPDFKNIEQVQKEIYDLNMKLLFSNIQTPTTLVHEVVVGDTLGKISKKYNVTMDLIKASNGMTGDSVRVGQKLRIWTGKFSINVDKSQNVLMLKSDEDVLKVYSVATGTNNRTPVGVFKIVTKLENPVWYKTDAVIPPESPENVLGTRWLGFDIKGYGIHGTVEPDKMGQQVTAGCVRMRNEDVEELYKIVPRNTEVAIAD